MDYFWAFIGLLAGLGAFLFGFKVLSESIEKLANSRMRRWFDKTAKSKLAGVGIGTVTTAIIQSSSATTVMVVGFVNAGIMTLYQATAIIMGANIGTTITAQIASLQAFDFIAFVTVFACVGVFMDMLGGLPLIFGTCIVASSVEMVISRILKYTRKIITPLVSGIVVTLIGMSLIKVGITACGGGVSAQSNGTFGSFENLGLALLVLILIILFNRSSNRYLRMSSIVIGLIIGYLVAWGLGRIDFSAVQSFGGFNIPLPFKYGLDFDFSAFIALGLVFLITAIEAYGDITANSLISGEPVEGKTFIKRASGGILADGFNSMMAGILNSFPNSVFAQNNGMIQLTGVASRYVGYYIAGFLILLGLFPSVGLIFSLMPEPVLGGATLLMFGTVASAGIRIIAAQKINRKATLVIALSFALGLSVEMVPEILCQFPESIKNIFSSGITTGGVTAIISNALIRMKE